MARTLPHVTPARAKFGALLKQHVDGGTRPGARNGEHWTIRAIAELRGVNRSERTVNYWLAGEKLPNSIASFLVAFFDDDPLHAAAREEFIRAYQAAKGAGPPAIPSPTPPPRPLTHPHVQVPPPPAHFMGRSDDIAAVRDALLSQGSSTSVLVQGSPGIGKTSLTQAVAHDPEVITRHGADRWFVALETSGSAEQMRDAVARVLDCDPALGFDAVLERLRQRPGLLILDNLETPWGPSQERRATEQTLADLAAVPGVGLLASFRGAERVDGPDWTLVHPVEKLDPEAATALFLRIARRPINGHPRLADFIEALDGLPLAIELVAHRVYGDTPMDELWERWRKIGARFAERPGLEKDRLSSLSASIELSLESDRLAPAARRLFRLLGRFPAGLAPEDRNALLGDDGFDADEALRGIGLAIRRDTRLDLLAPIRDYAAHQYEPEPDDDELWREHYLEMTERLGQVIGTDKDQGSIARLEPEFANIEAAFRDAVAHHHIRRAMAAVGGFGQLTQMASLPTPVFAELSIECHRNDDMRGEAYCIESLGNIALRRSDHDAARAAYEQALPLYQKVGDLLGEASCIRGLGDIALRRSDSDAARAAYERALPLYQKVRSAVGEANCIRSLGDIALRRSDHDAARTAYEQALPLYHRGGSVLGEANCIKSLGDIALRRSDHDTARTAYEQALPLYQKIGDALGEANCIHSLGDVALRCSDHDAAREAYEQALPLYQKIGDLLGEANCIRSLGDIALRRSDHNAARVAYEQTLPLYQQAGSVLGEANCIRGLGEIAFRRSDHDAAREAYEQALPLYQRVGSVLGEANCIQGLGDIALSSSDHDAARAAYERALPLYQRVGNRLGEENCLRKLAELSEH